MNLTEITDKIQEKLGKEESGKIADDIANILIFEESNNKTLKEKDDKISKLDKDKEIFNCPYCGNVITVNSLE